MRSERRSRRTILFDALEGRELLTSVAAPSAEVRIARAQGANVIHGTIQGTIRPGDPLPIPMSQFVLSGHGNLSVLGQVKLGASFVEIPIHASSSPTAGMGTLTKGTRTRLDFTFSGNVEAISPRKEVAPLTGLVVGRPGTVSIRATFNPRTERFTFQITVTLKNA